jgi:hypothetical protein
MSKSSGQFKLMSKLSEQFKLQEHSSKEVYKAELFRNLTTDAQSELSRIDSSEEFWQVKADLVKAIVLSGDIKSAKHEAEKIPINEEYAQCASGAFTSIVSGLAKEDPKKALELVPNILDEDSRSEALFEVLKAASDKWDVEKIQKLADQIIEIPYAYYQIVF